MRTPYPHLLSPVRLGPVEVRNRVVSTSHQTSHVHDHLPTEDLVAYHEARAAGGAGAIFLEATAVHPSGLLTPHTIGGYLPEVVPAYRGLAGAVQRHGARLLVQIFHGGREQIASAPRAPAVAPSAVPTLRFHTEPRALTNQEIREIVEGFAKAARYAREGGLDGVEVSMAHGYLAAQFFSPVSNRRSDGYNGDLQARLRFAREVLEAVRTGAGDALAVGVRLAADEIAPGTANAPACAEIAAALCRDGLVDFVSLAMGHSASYAGSVYIVPPPPAPRNAIEWPLALLRSAVPGLPLIATTRVLELADADRLVAAGTDLVGLTRALIADPDLVAKAEAGREDEVIPCIGCNQACIGHYHAGVPIACMVNPRTGRERSLPAVVRRASARYVLVVGAGPAGIAAAVEAARAGGWVTLMEREEQIGGQLRLAGLASAHAELWRRYGNAARRDLAAATVNLRLGEEAAPEDLDGYDLVVIATGARQHLPELPVGLPFTVVPAWEAIEHPTRVEGPVLVADWGGEWSGLDAAERLAEAGLEVELATAALHPGEQLHQFQRSLYLARLDCLGVRLRAHLELVVEDGRPALRHIFSGRLEELGAPRTLVIAQGRVPDDALWPAAEGRPQMVRVGDVLGPRTAEEAILEGTLAVRDGSGFIAGIA